MHENICHFVSTKNTESSINILNFVYEKEALFAPDFILNASYSLGLVTSGLGSLHTSFGKFSLQPGDLFFIFSAKPYYIENNNDLQYIYISFLGSRIPTLLDRLNVLKNAPVFPDFSHLIPFWEDAFLRITDDNIDLLCEGLLLHAFSNLCHKKEAAGHEEYYANGILPVKQYVDLHFTDKDLCLAFLSSKFSYNPKYLSEAFCRLTRISFSKYLTDKRLDYSLTLIDSGIVNIQELADMCGYNDATYFSKAFKAKFLIPPKQYIIQRTTPVSLNESLISKTN